MHVGEVYVISYNKACLTIHSVSIAIIIQLKAFTNILQSCYCSSFFAEVVYRDKGMIKTASTTPTSYPVVGNFGKVFNLAIWRIWYRSPN